MDESIPELKIVIVGESGVGKSWILLSLTTPPEELKELFRKQRPTIGCDIKTKQMRVDGVTVKLIIWDTAGQERLHSLPPTFYRDAQGVIVVYDVTAVTTFKKVEKWMDTVCEYNAEEGLTFMIVGNKIDKEGREVSEKNGQDLARKRKALFIETSAKNCIGIETAFSDLVQKILENNTFRKYDNGRMHLHHYDNPVDNRSRIVKCLTCSY